MQSSHSSHTAAPTLHQTPQGLLQDVPAYGFRLLSHRMSAGFPSPAADYTEEELDLNTYLVRNKPATFMFSVKGDSMIGASIEDGDKVVVDRSSATWNQTWPAGRLSCQKRSPKGRFQAWPATNTPGQFKSLAAGSLYRLTQDPALNEGIELSLAAANGASLPQIVASLTACPCCTGLARPRKPSCWRPAP